MAAPVVRSGGCQGGAVRFSVKGEPLRSGICHCLDCRRASGSAFSFFAIWPRSAFECTGELGTFEGRSFCRRCGSRVANLDAEEAEVMAGALDDAPSGLVPRYELWTPRRERWLAPVPGIPQFEGDRDVG